MRIITQLDTEKQEKLTGKPGTKSQKQSLDKSDSLRIISNAKCCA